MLLKYASPHVKLVACRFYPFYYAPLVSDLAKHATTVAKTKGITAKEAPDIGEEDDSVPGSWAPPHGPVRPLVQLMAVLPPARWRLRVHHPCCRWRFGLGFIQWQQWAIVAPYQQLYSLVRSLLPPT